MGKVVSQSICMLNLTSLVKTMEVSYWIYSIGSTKFAKKNIKVLTLFLTSKGIGDKHKVGTRLDRHSKTSMF